MKKAGFNQRYIMWMDEVSKVVKVYGVANEDVLKTIYLLTYNKSHNVKELMGWAEVHEFVQQYKDTILPPQGD